jgi:hypothetical protein
MLPWWMLMPLLAAWLTGAVAYCLMIHRVNVSGRFEDKIGWTLQHPLKTIKVFRRHKQVFPASRLPSVALASAIAFVVIGYISMWAPSN